MLLNAVALPSLYYLGSEPVPTDKTNEIPIARKLFDRLDLQGKTVVMDALHTQRDTARSLVIDHGADYLFTVKENQKGVLQNVNTFFAAHEAAFPPSEDNAQ